MIAPRVTRLVLLVFGGLLLAGPVAAQAPSEEPPTYTKYRVFSIPFQTDAGERPLKEIQLFYSPDQGRSWQPSASVRPDQKNFKFTTDRDGVFWFTVRTVDADGRPFPVSLEGARPGLKVIVDTVPPVIDLRVLPPRDGQTGVAWDVRDDNLDLASMRLEYHVAGAADWRALSVEPAATGEHYWRPDANGAQEVRLRARDRADNQSEQKVVVAGASDNRTGMNPAVPDAAPAAPAAGPGVRMINSKRISLNYEVKDKGPSGVSVVELWYTQDGRSWQKYGDKPEGSPYVIDVNDEGLYGFTLVVRSGVGLGDRPPQVGDPPQLWVEVDLTKPIVRLQDVEVGRGVDSGKLTVSYEARDKNLGRQPITISYAETAAGPWTPIVEHVENTGRYVWQMSAGVPYQFLVKVEAADRSGNVGADQTSAPVKVDLSQPKGVILDVTPGK